MSIASFLTSLFVIAVAPSGSSSSVCACEVLGFSQDSPYVSSEIHNLVTPSLNKLRLASKSFPDRPSSFVLMSSISRTMICLNLELLMSPSFRGRLHGRVVPAKRVDSLYRVDPLSIVIPYYFNITITW